LEVGGHRSASFLRKFAAVASSDSLELRDL